MSFLVFLPSLAELCLGTVSQLRVAQGFAGEGRFLTPACYAGHASNSLSQGRAPLGDLHVSLRPYKGAWPAPTFAILAQLVERIHGKDEVVGSIPTDGSEERSDEEAADKTR